MKLFSRKALAAVATTVALTAAGVSAPANAASSAPTITILAEDSTPAPSLGLSSGADAAGGEDKKGSSSEDAANGEEKKGSSEDSNEIKGWLEVASTLITVLATVFSFVQKLNA